MPPSSIRRQKLESLSEAQLLRTFQVERLFDVLPDKAALAAPEAGRERSSIQPRSPPTAAARQLLDYSASQGAIVAFTRSLSLALAERGILVNGVAPGPVYARDLQCHSTWRQAWVSRWTRPGLPDEIACCYLFLASDDSRLYVRSNCSIRTAVRSSMA